MSQTSDSQLSEGGLNKIVDDVQPQSTERSTKWGVKKLEVWLSKRAIMCDFHSVPAEELNMVLRRFYGELKSVNGDLFTSSALTGIRAAIHRYITGPPFNRSINIIQDKEFMPANRMFVAKFKLYVKSGCKKPQHKPAIGTGDMNKLSGYFNQWDKNPEVLVEAVWFMLCFHFGRRGREGWTNMTVDTFKIHVDSEGISFLTPAQTETTKNHQGGYKQSDVEYTDQRMQVSRYISSTCQSETPKCSRLFQTPLKIFQISDACKSMVDLWYKNEAMGKCTLGTIMQRISKKSGLSQIFTCHSVRVSTITTLFQAGIPCQQIMRITNHKRETIEDTTEAQKRHNSSILANSLPIKVTFRAV